MSRLFWLNLKYEDFAANRFWTNLFDGPLSDGGLIRGLAAAAPIARPAAAGALQVAAAAGVVPQLIIGPALFVLAPLQLAGGNFEPGPSVSIFDPTLPVEPIEILPLGPSALLGTLDLPTGIAVAIMDVPTQSGLLSGVGVQSTIPGGEGRFQILFDDNLTPSLVVDTAKMEILGGGAQDPVFGAGVNDMLVLSGGFDGGADLPTTVPGLDRILVQSGSTVLTGDDASLAHGDALTIDAMPLGPGHHVEFDGSAESDGRFVFFGSAGDDLFRGGAGDDRIYGENGADELSGGDGADVFAYGRADDSTGAFFDTLTDFDPGEDRIDLLGSVSGFADAIEGGNLSIASFDADLGAIIGADGLDAGQALLFAPDTGDLAGTLFLIVDANGEAGYQAGEDFVFALPSGDLAALDDNTGIFV